MAFVEFFTKHLVRRITALCLFALCFMAPSKAHAEYVSSENRGWTYDRVVDEYYDQKQSTQDRRGELPIGIPSFKRRVNLPKVRKGDDSTGVKLGALRLHPAYSQIYELDDNVRLSREDEETDSLFRELPALTGEVQNSNLRVSGGYGMEIVNFTRLKEENSINHFAHGMVEYQFDDLSFSIEDTLEKSQSRLSNANSTRDHVLANAVQVLAKYDRPKWALEPGWTHNTIIHDSATLKNLSYEEDVLTLLGGYKIFPKTLLLIQNDFGFDYYHRKLQNGDQNFWQIMGGVRGEYIENMSVEAKMGFQTRRVEELPGQDHQEDYNGMVADLNVSYAITPRDAVSLDYIRTVQPATAANNHWYSLDRVSLSYSKRFFDKWILTPQAGWQVNRYPEAIFYESEFQNRDDQFWQTGVDLRYQFKEWLSAGAAYRFRSRASNFDTVDYSNNRFICDVTLSY